jgi:hypothetical protein
LTADARTAHIGFAPLRESRALHPKHKSSGELHPPAPRVGREYLELWISLSRRQWGSLVLIPADREGSTAEVANALADIGQRLSYEPVTAIAVSSLEYGSALALADLQQHLNRERRSWGDTVVSAAGEASPNPGAEAPVAGGAPAGGRGASEAGSSAAAPWSAGEPAKTEALMVTPLARLIISVPPVVTEPLGLAAAHNADAIVLAVRMNRSRIADVRRTIELVGQTRVMGCVLLR